MKKIINLRDKNSDIKI